MYPQVRIFENSLHFKPFKAGEGVIGMGYMWPNYPNVTSWFTIPCCSIVQLGSTESGQLAPLSFGSSCVKWAKLLPAVQGLCLILCT